MKKILFCLQTMVCGGVEKELITILKRFDRTKYKLSVLLMYEQDTDIQKMIPEDVEIIKLNIDKDYFCSNIPKLIVERVKKGHLYEALKLGVSRVINNNPAPKLISLERIPAQEEYYDYAVCYHLHSPIVLRYVEEKVKANKKIAWIHNDFTTTGYKIEKYKKCLEKYEKIVAVSRQIGTEFVDLCPQYEERVIIAHNMVDEEEILNKSQETDDLDMRFVEDKRIKLVTVGRFVEQKGFDIAILACKQLLDEGIDIAWFAIGYGKEKEKMKRMIADNKLENNFFILGKKENPYPYIGKADIYVQPSRHEGFGLVIAEAKILNRLIVCTNFAGAAEQIKDRVNGVIAPTCDVSAICDAIKSLVNDPLLVERISKEISLETNDEAWKQIKGVFKDEQ